MQWTKQAQEASTGYLSEMIFKFEIGRTGEKTAIEGREMEQEDVYEKGQADRNLLRGKWSSFSFLSISIELGLMVSDEFYLSRIVNGIENVHLQFGTPNARKGSVDVVLLFVAPLPHEMKQWLTPQSAVRMEQ